MCLASLAYDWVTACWDSLSILLHAGIACLAYDWVITNGCFNPFGVSSYYGIAQPADWVSMYTLHLYSLYILNIIQTYYHYIPLFERDFPNVFFGLLIVCIQIFHICTPKLHNILSQILSHLPWL